MNYVPYISDKAYESLLRLEKGNSNAKRYAELLKLIVVDSHFQKLVTDIRAEMKIPTEELNLKTRGNAKRFKRYVQPTEFIRDFLALETISLGNSFDLRVATFLKEKGLCESKDKFYYNDLHELNLSVPISAYILTGSFLLLESCEMISVAIEDWDGTPEITLQVSPHVSKKELTDFVDRNWNSLRFVKKKIIKKSFGKRNKIKKNYFRDIFIVSKFNEFKKTGAQYPDLKTATFLRKEHEINLSEGTVRSIVSRTQKLVANKKA